MIAYYFYIILVGHNICIFLITFRFFSRRVRECGCSSRSSQSYDHIDSCSRSPKGKYTARPGGTHGHPRKKRRINPELIVKYSESSLPSASNPTFTQAGKGDTLHEYLKLFPDSSGAFSQVPKTEGNVNTAFSSAKSPNPSQPEGHITGHAIAKKSPEKVDTTKQTVVDESQPKSVPGRVCGRVHEADKTQDSESTIEYCNVTDQSDLGEGDCMQTASMQEGSQTAPQLSISYTENHDGTKSVCSNAKSLVTKESVQLSPKKVISENAKEDNLERPSKQLSVKEKTKPNSKERPLSIDDKPKSPMKTSPVKCEQTNVKPDSATPAATFDAAKGVWVGGSSTSTTSHKTPKSISKSRSSGSCKESSSHRSSSKHGQRTQSHSQSSHSGKDKDQRTKQHSSRSKSDSSHHKEHSSSKKGHDSHKKEDAPSGQIDQTSDKNDVGKDLKSTNVQIIGASEDHVAPVVQSSESRGKGKVVSRRGSKDKIPTQNMTKDRKEDKHKSSRSRTRSQSDGKQREKKSDKSSQSKEQDPIEEAKKVFHNFVVRRDSRSRSNSPDPHTLAKPSNCQGKETTESKKQKSTEDVCNEEISSKESEKTHNDDTQKDVTTRSSRSKTRRKTLDDSNSKSETKTVIATHSRTESKTAEKDGTSSAKSEKKKERSSSTKTSSQGKSKHSETIKQTEPVLKKTPGQKIGSYRETSPAGNENLAEATQTLVKPTLSETKTGTGKKHQNVPSSKISEKAHKDQPASNKLKSKEKAKGEKSSSGVSKQSTVDKNKKEEIKTGEGRLVLSDSNNVPVSESDGKLSRVKIRETAQKRTKVGEGATEKTGPENSSPPLCKPLVSVPVDIPPDPAQTRKFVIPKLKKPAVPVPNVKKEKETSEKKDIKPVKREAPSPCPRKKPQNISTTLIKSQERKPMVNDLPTEHAPDAIVIAPIPIVSDLLQSPELPGTSEVPRDVYPPTPQNLNYTASRQGPTLTPRSFDKMISRISDQLQSPELPGAGVVPREAYPPTPTNLNYMASRQGPALTPRSFGKMISHISGELAAELPGAGEVPREAYPPTPQNLNYTASRQGPALTPRSFDKMISHISDELTAAQVPRDPEPRGPQILVTTNQNATNQPAALDVRALRDPRIIAAKRREHVKSVPSLMDMDLSVNAATVSKQTDTNTFQILNDSYPSEPVDRHAHQIQNQPPAPLPPSGNRALQIPSQPNVTLPNKSMPSLMDLDVSVTATASKQMDANTFQVPNNRYLPAAVDRGTHLIQHQPPTVPTLAGTRALQIPSQPNVALPNILQSLLGKTTTEQSVSDLSAKTTESVHIETCVKENEVNDKPREIKVGTRRQVRDSAVVTTRKVNNSSAVMTDKINDSQVEVKITENEKSKPATNILEIKPTRTTYPVPKPTKVLPIPTDAERLLAYASLSSRRNKELLINHKRCNRAEQKRRKAKKPERKSEHLEGETLYGGCTSGLPRVPPTPEKMLQDLTTQLSSEELEELWNQGVDVTDPEVLATFLRLRDEHADQVVPPQHMELDDSPPRVTEWGEVYNPQYFPYPQGPTLATHVHGAPPASLAMPASTGEAVRQPDPSENDWSSDDEREAVNMDKMSESTEKFEVTKLCPSAKIHTSVPTDKISDQVCSVKQEAVVDEPEKIIEKDLKAPQSENQDKVNESQPLDVPEKADGFCDAEKDYREPETQLKEKIEETECSQSDSQGSLEGSRSGIVTDESNSSQPMECQMEGGSPNPESPIEVTKKEKTESVEVTEHKGESPSNEPHSSGNESKDQETKSDFTFGSKTKISGESENQGKNVEQSFKPKTSIDSPEFDCSEVSLNSGSTEPLEQHDNETLDEQHDDRSDSMISNDSEDVKTSPLAKCPEGEVCKTTTVIHTPQRQDQDSEKPRRFPILQLESLREEVVVKVSISSDDMKQDDSKTVRDTEIEPVEGGGEAQESSQEKVESDVKGEKNKTKRQELELELFGEDSIQVSMNCSDVNIKEEVPKRNTNTENKSTILSSEVHFKHTKEEKKTKRRELEMELFGEDSIQVSMNCSDVNKRQEIANPNKVTENKSTILTSKAHFKDIEEEKKTKRKELEMELFGEDSIQVSMNCSDVSFKGEISKSDRNTQNRFNIKSEVHVNELEQDKKNIKRQKLELELIGEDSIQVGEDSSHMSLSQRDVTSQEPLLQNTEKKINKQTSENKHDLDLDVESDLDLDVGDTEYAINPAEVQIDIDVDPSGEDTTDSSGSWIDSSLSSAETEVTIDKFVTSTADITDKPSVPESNAPTRSTFNINQMSTENIAKPPTDSTTYPDSKRDQEEVVINDDSCADRKINVQEKENNKAGDDVIIDESESDGAAAKNVVGPEEVAKRKSDEVEEKTISKNTPEKDNDLNISGESLVDPVVPKEVAENKSEILGKNIIPNEKDLNISGDSLIDLGDTSDANSEGACGGDEMSEDLDLTLKSDNKSGKCDEDLSDSCSSASVSGGSSLHCESNTDDDMDDLDGDFNTSSSLEKTLCPEETTIEEAKEDCSDDSPECFGDVLELHAADDPTLFDEESQQSTKVTTPKRPPKKKICTSTPRSPKPCTTPKALRTTPRKARSRSKPMQRTLSLGKRTYRNSSPKTPLKGSKEKVLSAASIAVEEGEVVSDEEEEELTPKSKGPSRSRHSDQRPKRRRTLSRDRDGKRARVDDHRTPSGSDRHHNTSASSSSSRHSASRDKKISPSHRDSRSRQRRSRTPDRATPSTSKQPSRRSESYSHRDTQKDSQRNTESLSRGWRRER